jgi:DNA-binding MarR family transcriptional regulator
VVREAKDREAKGRQTKDQVASDVWTTLIGFFFAYREAHLGAVHELGLTPGDMKAFMILQPDEPKSMGALAEQWACDASNATWMVDRLEERGFVERRAREGDRRVKTVVLTPAGEKMKAQLIERLCEPPADLLDLERADLEALRAALAHLPPTPPFGA